MRGLRSKFSYEKVVPSGLVLLDHVVLATDFSVVSLEKVIAIVTACVCSPSSAGKRNEQSDYSFSSGLSLCLAASRRREEKGGEEKGSKRDNQSCYV